MSQELPANHSRISDRSIGVQVLIVTTNGFAWRPIGGSGGTSPLADWFALGVEHLEYRCTELGGCGLVMDCGSLVLDCGCHRHSCPYRGSRGTESRDTAGETDLSHPLRTPQPSHRACVAMVWVESSPT